MKASMAAVENDATSQPLFPILVLLQAARPCSNTIIAAISRRRTTPARTDVQI